MNPRLYRSIGTALGLALMVTGGRAEDGGTVNTNLIAARTAIHHQRLDEARSLIQDALRSAPGDVQWRLIEADLHAAQGHVVHALGKVREIIREDSTNRRGRMREAQLLNQLGRPASAANAYRRYLAEEPADFEARVALGATHYLRGNWAEAEQLFADVLKEEPGHETGLYAYVRVLVASGRVSLAWRVADEQDRQTQRKDAELGLILAGIASRIGAYDRADDLASRPTEDLDLKRRQDCFRARQLIRLGHHTAGLDLIRGYCGSEIRDYDALMEVGNAFQAADQRVMARALFERAREVTPERPEAWLGLARLASREGRLSGSLSYYEKVVEANPEAIEGWMGVIRIANLLDAPDRVAQALKKAWEIAPRSAFLYQEDMRLALQVGDLEGFAASLADYIAQQPEDRSAWLWAQRARHASGEALDIDTLSQILDPLNPEETSICLNLFPTSNASPEQILAGVPNVPDDVPAAPAFATLADHFALLLRRDLVQAAATQAGPESGAWATSLANGWWAYVSVPYSCLEELHRHFDAQALAPWLALEVQRRLRVMQSESESRLWEDWLLRRAVWFTKWRGQWDSPAAASDLMQSLRGLVLDWQTGARAPEIEAAWKASESPLPASLDTYSVAIMRARFRQHRYDFDGALKLLEQIHRTYPDSTEPLHRRSQILRNSGRPSAAATILASLASLDTPSPLIRLDYAELLRKRGQRYESAHQLRLLRDQGFFEPEYFLQEALLSESAGLDAQAWDWSKKGLKVHPRAPVLLAYQADWLMRHRRDELVARMLESGPVPIWADAEIVARAADYLPASRLEEILGSPGWRFAWRWVAWNRLGNRSLGTLQLASTTAAAEGGPADALQVLQPALDARIPDSELWLRAARLLYLNGDDTGSRQAYGIASLLGGRRPDADVAELTQLARRQPRLVARELARRLEDQPDDASLQIGLVLALLRAGEIGAADRALAPLLETERDNPEIHLLAAQVKAAKGRVNQARSLYSSLLLDDPLAADIHAGRAALKSSAEWGVTLGVEYAGLKDTTGSGSDPSPWKQLFLSAFLRRPYNQTFSVEYDWFERSEQQAHQILAAWNLGMGKDWILQLNTGAGLSGDLVARWRLGGGVSRRAFEEFFVSLDLNYLDFADINVLQVVPGIVWQWTPRGRFQARGYLTFYQGDDGESDLGVVWAFDHSWQVGSQSWLILNYAVGGVDVTNTDIVLYGDDTEQSFGVSWRQGWRQRWTIQPGYRYEIHRNFDLHACSLSVGCRF